MRRSRGNDGLFQGLRKNNWNEFCVRAVVRARMRETVRKAVFLRFKRMGDFYRGNVEKNEK
jgi:hypothetical protein